ncbi:hypothetical protein [Mycolicibacterium llatzerense]|uniref:hypothetical protein n=1 Tax=Mycolicibacterium llatzerense TaxID=280871 RepID=UPI0008DE07D4|nr:hypothetical protein [Mycolicibacterium llatzerense]
MTTTDEQLARWAASQLGDIKHALFRTLRGGQINRAQFEEIVAVIDFMEWIGATVAEACLPIIRHPKPGGAAWIFAGAGGTLDSMSECPQQDVRASERPPLPQSGFHTLPNEGEFVRRRIATCLDELQFCKTSFGIATCARMQQLYVAVGGADPIKALADRALNEHRLRYPPRAHR